MHEGGGSMSGWSEGGSCIWSTLGVPSSTCRVRQ